MFSWTIPCLDTSNITSIICYLIVELKIELKLKQFILHQIYNFICIKFKAHIPINLSYVILLREVDGSAITILIRAFRCQLKVD